MTKAEAITAHPDFPWLAADQPAAVERLLKQIGFLSAEGRVVSCAKAGEGNMNLALRVGVEEAERQQSVIAKQSRPWVEKYDFIAAPWDRALSEAAFYRKVAAIRPVASRMPKLLASDAASRVLVLEDLGESRDLTNIYKGEPLSKDLLTELADYLRSLHDATRGGRDEALTNRDMRKLNHEHIYEIPLREKSGVDLEKIEPALLPAARELRADDEYLRLVRETGARYLADGDCLVHGDYFPGSWLATHGGVRVIDPEFCFYGDAEFDVAIFAAHLALAQRPIRDLLTVMRAYGRDRVNLPLTARFAACEVMRRLIGVAQLPLPPGAWRAELLLRSREAMKLNRLEAMWPA